ncbi:MAG: hypothetical protein ACYDIA_02225 [Candidatus Humimicrobiaceae bacterium]
MKNKMLFDSVFNNPTWKGKDDFPAFLEWKLEINKRLEFIKNKNELNRFLKRLNATKTQRDEALSEILAAYILEEKLNYKIIEWERNTIGKRDVDFVIMADFQEIYCEVKSPGWEAELNQTEKTSGRKLQPKYINAEVRSLGPWENIQYSIIKAYPKFLTDKNNMVIMCHDLFLGLLEDDLNTNIALYSKDNRYNSIIKKEQKGCFSNNTFENIGGLLIIEDNLYSGNKEVTYKYKFFPNNYSLNRISLKL